MLRAHGTVMVMFISAHSARAGARRLVCRAALRKAAWGTVLCAHSGCSASTGAHDGGTTQGTEVDGTGQTARDAAPPSAGSPAYERLDCDLPAALSFCGGGTCHYEDSAEFGSSLALVSREGQLPLAGVEARLVNAPASYHNVGNADDCPLTPELLIDVADVEQSLVLKKLSGTHRCGDEMPKFPYPEWGATNNPGDEREQLVACVREWVTLLAEEFQAR